MPSKKPKTRARLRFTPGPPTREALKKYPLWCAALDEEERPGQDESTVRPSDDQERIDWTTAYVAAVARTADGRCFDAMISSSGYGMTAPSEIEQVTIWFTQKPVVVKLLTGIKVWMPRTERAPIGYHTDRYLPLEIRSVPLAARGDAPLVITLFSDGTLRFEPLPARVPALPPLIRPSDLDPGDRSVLEWNHAFVGIELSQPGEPIVARSTSAMRREGDVFIEHESFRRFDPGFHHEFENRFDAHTLRALLRTQHVNGNLKTVARAGARGRAGIPNDCFHDASTVLLLLPLTEGWSARVPTYDVLKQEVQHVLVKVEAIEPAPRQPGSRAFRILLDSAPTAGFLMWHDVATRRLLAMEGWARHSTRRTLYLPAEMFPGS